MEPKQPVQVYLEKDYYKRLKKLAIDSEVSMSTLLRSIVKTYIDKRGR